ncbi:hypothetical protein VTH82DRAFT_8440 [Thermothelomyces myriococcoides]
MCDNQKEDAPKYGGTLSRLMTAGAPSTPDFGQKAITHPDISSPAQVASQLVISNTKSVPRVTAIKNRMSGSAAQSLADKLAGLPITLKPSGEPPRCQGCDHPRPVVYTGGYTAKRSRLGTMLANAEDGKCDVCAILSQGIVKFLDSEGCPLKKEQVDSLLIDYNTAGSRRNIDVTFVQTSVKLSFFVPEITPWLAENMPDLSLGNHVPRATWSDESTAWAIRQLEHCRRTHESCNSFPPAPLPSRVLDVSVNDGTGVRLYVTQGETAPYAALSHCWGRRPFLRTMSGSLEDHRNEISWAQLPRTFREAVEFVRKLGIRYLWIDSLCIVQDDLEDWRREASRMASVYQNAAFVVSAAKAAGAYGGLYADLPPACRPLTVRYKPRRRQRQPQQGGGQQEEDSEEVVVHVRRALSHPYLTTTQYHPQISALRIFTPKSSNNSKNYNNYSDYNITVGTSTW